MIAFDETDPIGNSDRSRKNDPCGAQAVTVRCGEADSGDRLRDCGRGSLGGGEF